jgi:uncharacterized protein involved in exopolysaccharide biosynthesis/Mrp family chromosome partitioning ATPase
LKPPETIAIGARQTESSQSQLGPADIAYLLFRHKWKILFFAICGIAAATSFFLTQTPTYISEAKVLIRYVQESRSIAPADSSDAIRSPDTRGDNILNSEVELITSLDLAEEVAIAVGITNILSSEATQPDLPRAAKVIQGGLRVNAPRKSNVILLSFRHTDPAVTRSVLTNIVAGYLRMHARVHRALAVQDDLSRQADLRRTDLEKTESELRIIKDALGITSLEDARKNYSEQLARTRQDLLSTEALLAEAQAGFGHLQTNRAQAALEAPSNNPPVTLQAPVTPRETIAAYENTVTQIDSLNRRLQDLLLQYTEDHLFVTSLRARVQALKAERAKLESENPGLLTFTPSMVPRSASSGGSSSLASLPDRATEYSKVVGLQARWETLQRQLAQTLTNLARLSAREPEITELERKRALHEQDYRYYSSAVEEAHVAATLLSGRLANISVVQAASPPVREIQTLAKLVIGALVGGFVLGIGIAIAIEFFLDSSLRRPMQVSKSLNIPVFLTVPRLGRTDRSITRVTLPAPQPGPGGALVKRSDQAEGPANAIVAYAEALRDRVIMHFQIRELHHKPKLVGVTSCGHGAGATTLATSLAASLSETGEGNVLYVDANPDLGPSVKAFYRGKQAAGIASALDEGSRSVAKVNDNFYMAALNDLATGGKVGVLPKKLANLLPQMKASDFDYIIFDLPPVTQTSATARVAGLLDMTLLVLESEKTHGDLAKQVTGLLRQSRADVAAVLNKHRQYLPQRLNPDL